LALAANTSISPDQAAPVLDAASSAPLAHAVRIVEVARRQNISLHALFAAAGIGASLSRDAITTAELEIKYEGYLSRERTHADKLRRLGDFSLPADLDYGALHSLSIEARQKLIARTPTSLAQAARIPGVSPTDLQNLVIEIEKRRRTPASG
jgi:tRNA uridine 5-carboxymethylaminomethyl modification enzyme